MSSQAPNSFPSTGGRDTLEKVTDFFSILQAIATIVALIAAVWWFTAQGEARPKLTTEHLVLDRKIDDSKRVLTVEVVLSNVGNVKVDLPCVKVRIYELAPNRNEWIKNEKGECTKENIAIEAGETYPIYDEFVTDSKAKTIAVYSFVPNPIQSKIGWGKTSIHDMGNDEELLIPAAERRLHSTR